MLIITIYNLVCGMSNK